MRKIGYLAGGEKTNKFLNQLYLVCTVSFRVETPETFAMDLLPVKRPVAGRSNDEDVRVRPMGRLGRRYNYILNETTRPLLPMCTQRVDCLSDNLRFKYFRKKYFGWFVDTFWYFCYFVFKYNQLKHKINRFFGIYKPFDIRITSQKFRKLLRLIFLFLLNTLKEQNISTRLRYIKFQNYVTQFVFYILRITRQYNLWIGLGFKGK